ncbi:conserved protein of unknown function [Sterolibacterium denitrificans]|uniref:Uncharacterized protein n=1 Tax=Sterolibacterium denitrificans TaxID=157592 RepID=A0A7Z7HRR4_9PROT|nr:hypothetical protein [Sterolibacterium denitrificans]SMB27284.1 conserved protein of unknown function [Sterolibacterium denitrificans]
MKVKVIGVKRLSGVGKESGKPFDFAQISVLRPVEPATSEKFSLEGYGFEVADLDLATDAVAKFRDVRFPAELDLQVDNVPGRKGLRSVVTGFSAQVVSAGVAGKAAA